ncbi:APC family permease [Algoriphagus namhaensis]
MSQIKEEGLKRELGIWDVITNVLSISIGSGIFLLPALVYAILGHASILAYLLCGLIFLCLGLCFGEVSSRIEDTGGVYVYIERAFGPLAGFVANILYWFGVGVMACGALLNALADIAASFFPIFETFGARLTLFSLILGIITFLSIKGIKDSMILIRTLTFLKVTALVGLVIFGFSFVDQVNLSWEGWPKFNQLGEASLLLIFAFLGGELSLSVSGELKNPKRTAPLGFIIGIIGVVLVFCSLHLVVQGVLGEALIANQEAPLAQLAKTISGDVGFTLILIVSFIAVWSTFSSIFLLKSRILFAASVDGLLPDIFSKLHPKYGTPVFGILFLAVLDLVFAASGSFRYLLILVTAASIVVYVGVILAFFKFRIKEKVRSEKVFYAPAGYVLGSFALVALGWIFFQLGSNELLACLVFILSLIGLFYLSKFVKKRIN